MHYVAFHVSESVSKDPRQQIHLDPPRTWKLSHLICHRTQPCRFAQIPTVLESSGQPSQLPHGLQRTCTHRTMCAPDQAISMDHSPHDFALNQQSSEHLRLILSAYVSPSCFDTAAQTSKHQVLQPCVCCSQTQNEHTARFPRRSHRGCEGGMQRITTALTT